MNRVIVIAEVGECFNGELKIAKEMIAVARDAGCDIVKFQTLDYENISETDPEKDWFKKIALDPKKMCYLIGCAKEAGIDILFTPENVKTAGWILDAGLKSVKIASSCMSDAKLIKFVNGRFDQVFISTGMADLEEVKTAVRNLDKVRDLYILHCVSEYPTGPLLEKRGLKALADEDAHLNMIKILIREFPDHSIGYSDHASGIMVPAFAVAAGAKVIEKHITLDRDTPVKNFKTNGQYLGTDHILSLEPDELGEMIAQIRLVEKMLGEDRWERSDGEQILKEFLRKRFSDAKA